MTTTTTIDTPYPNRLLARASIDSYVDAMRDFVSPCLSTIGGDPRDLIRESLPTAMVEDFNFNTRSVEEPKAMFEEAHLPHIINKYWDNFREQLIEDYDKRRDFRNRLLDIKGGRNRSTHRIGEVRGDVPFTAALNLMKTIIEVLRTIGDEEELKKVEQLIVDLEKSAANQSESERTPWKDAIVPHQDIIDGLLLQSQFAANLQEVYDGRADDTVYGNPVMFFRHTYLTEGITDLLTESLRRLAGKGGHPIIKAQTSFGGGKTHSLIALYHLVTSSSIIGNTSEEIEDHDNRARIREILRNSGANIDEELQPAVSVLHGTHLSPTDSATTPKGDPLNTLWGVMAYQLAGEDGYEIIGEAARTGIAPGGQQLQALFRHAGPSLILVDELVNYARNLEGLQLDRLYTFFQNLTDVIPGTDNVVMVVSLPASEREQGDERAIEATKILENILTRVEAVWRPADPHEGFEVIRRRLFQDYTCNEKAREVICEEFRRLYRRENVRKNLPENARTEEYIQRIKESYPIHPELFDRLFEDWGTKQNFQQTRGALRMMASFIHHLYYSDNSDPLIMPGNLPLQHTDVNGQFLSLLSENWNPVFSEVDSPNSRVHSIDDRNENSRRWEVAQRIARAIFLGSMPERHNPGLTDRQVRLGVLMPGLPMNDYNQALSLMDQQLLYLYRREGRRYFNAELRVDRAAADRKSIFQYEDDDHEIATIIEDLCSNVASIVVCPTETDEIPDRSLLQIVILRPEAVYSSNSDTASAEATTITRFCGGEPRRFPNALIFNAMHAGRLQNLRSIARSGLAWKSLVEGSDRIDHLSDQGRLEVSQEITNAQQDLVKQLANAYNYVAVPKPSVNGELTFKWEPMRFTQDHRLDEELSGLIDSAESKWFAEYTDQKIQDTILQTIAANSPFQHVRVSDAIDYLASDLTHPRIAGVKHFQAAVSKLIDAGTVGYATSHDPASGIYIDLVVAGGQPPDAIELSDLLLDSESSVIANVLAADLSDSGASANALQVGDGLIAADEDFEGPVVDESTVKATAADMSQKHVEEVADLELQSEPYQTRKFEAAFQETEESSEEKGSSGESVKTQTKVSHREDGDLLDSETIQLRYNPRNTNSHQNIRMFINQVVRDLLATGSHVKIEQETTHVTVAEMQDVPRRIESSESTRTEIVVTVMVPAELSDEIREIFAELVDRASSEESIVLFD